MRKQIHLMAMGLVLLLASCGEEHKAQGLVKDFVQENTENRSCSFERFSRLKPTAMIGPDRVKSMRQDVARLPYVKQGIDYHDGEITDTLRFLQTTYELTPREGQKQKITQTFYLDKNLTRVVAFKEY